LSDMQDISALQGLMNGNNKDSMTTTVAYKLNLRGPGITVQTACSTSLAATHMACRGLLNHEADMAIAGGVWVNLVHNGGYHYQPGAILSPDGHCRAFDAKAAGTVIGSGAGVVVLKRLADALADGDTIHAVIKGSAVNNDGSAKAGYTAPSIEGQAEVILAAQANAGIAAETVSYIEAHGTGTTIGDPIEIAALTQAFRESTDKRGFCGIGSVKTNVGHLDAAAGVAGLIKTALALKNRVLPPSLNFEQPNPQIDFSSSPFYVISENKAWPNGANPRRAGVSSFGIGGTNVHMVVEETTTKNPSGPSRDWQTLMISARSSTALQAAMTRLQSHLATHPEQPLADVAYTLQVGRKNFAYRAIALCKNREDALSLLQSRDGECFMTQQVAAESRPVTFLFPGQGAQYVDMARQLYQNEPVFRQEFDRCIESINPHLNFDLSKILFPADNEEDRALASARLEQTEVTQPALFVIEYALAKLWMSWGIQPTSMIGHSVGEYVAACLADVFSLEDAVQLVAMRGRLLQQMDRGAMLAVTMSEEKLMSLMTEGCDLAAVNGPELCVLSGSIAAIDAIEKRLAEKEIACRRLRVSHAFHSSMVEPIIPAFVDLVANVKPRPPKLPFFSNLSGDWITDQAATDPKYWGRHLRETVRFNDGLQKLLKNQAQVFLEIGPGETLITLAQRHPLAKPEQLMVSSLPHPNKSHDSQKHLHLGLGKLWLNGLAIDWESYYTHERRQRVPLPTYPFERQTYWIAPGKQDGGIASYVAKAQTSAIKDWLYVPTWRRTQKIELEKLLIETSGCFLIFSDENMLGAALIKQLLNYGIEPVIVSAGAAFQRKSKHHYVINPNTQNDFGQLFQNICEEGKPVHHILYLWSLELNNDALAQTENLGRYFYSLLYLGTALDNNKSKVPSGKKVRITIVTNQLSDVAGNETLCPEKTLLTGPCKVIPQEYAYINCRLIDVELPKPDSDAESQLVRNILAESHTDGDHSIVAYRGPHRWVQSFEQSQYPSPTTRIDRFKSGGVYFITGGLGGIGLTLAEHLARKYQAKLVLLGRSPIPPSESWSEILSTEDKDSVLHHKIESIMKLKALGAEVLVLSADVADLSKLKAAVAQARTVFGAINGVIHAAGEVSSGLMSLKTEKRIEQVFRPKVQGMQVLQAIFKGDSLDFMLLCSSLAAVAGGLSKVDYCAANAYLDAVAQASYRTCTYPIISVNWDSWREVGMAANMNMPDGVGIAPNDGAEIFECIVNGPNTPQVIVSTTDLQSRLNSGQQNLLDQPFAMTSSTEKAKTARFSRPMLQTIFKSPESELEMSIAEIWQSLLGIEAVGVDDNLFELGGDSLLGIQLLSRVRTSFSVELHPAEFFQSPTISSLAALVEAKLLDEIECS
jgi:phthiocerol/phenolphthiocerol synthesis type-I polyketide synthase E